jgi:hypothetical protein
MRYYFSPQEHWVCRRVCWSNEFGEEQRNCYYTAKEGEAFPAIRRLEDYLVTEHGGKTSTSQWRGEITEYKQLAPFPASDFTLSAFGLPEPGIAEPPQPPRNWLWLIFFAVLFSTLGCVFFWLNRRSMRTAVS